MAFQRQAELKRTKEKNSDHSHYRERIFSKDYVEFLNEAGWRLEKKLPSNRNYYSDLLEDTDWNYHLADYKSSKHYRRDLDALS